MEIERARELLGFGAEKDRFWFKKLSTMEFFEGCDASWIYQGKPGEPHALLASGLHSDGYFNVNAALQFPNLTTVLARRLKEKLAEYGINEEDVDVVISSTFAATAIGWEVARALNAMFVFTEKKDGKQTWSGRFEIPARASVLQVEELITTLGTAREVREEVLYSNYNPLRFVMADGKIAVATIVHRPQELPIEYLEANVIALIEKAVQSWPPDQCPLCETGSEVLAPKPNWHLFQM